MRAKLLPLDKWNIYYGTHILITDDCGFEFEITLWNNGNYEPSDRWLDGVCTIEQWRRNEVITTISSNGKKFSMPAKEYIDICDSHFESRVTYNTAMHIVNLINNENTTNE